MAEYNREHSFELPVTYRGTEMQIPGRLVQMGYTYKIFLEPSGGEVAFEPDEEQNFRVISENPAMKGLSVELFQAINDALEKFLR